MRQLQITLILPDDSRPPWNATGGMSRDRPLKRLAVEGYRTAALTESQVRCLLGLDTRFQVHALLKAHRVPLRYTQADLEDDLAAHRELGILRGR